MNSIIVDWSTIYDFDSFFDSVFIQMEAPDWHGRNLNALQDSWVNGDICKSGPPFHFIFKQSKFVSDNLKEFIFSIEEIAEESVREHGGAFHRQKDNTAEQGAAANP